MDIIIPHSDFLEILSPNYLLNSLFLQKNKKINVSNMFMRSSRSINASNSTSSNGAIPKMKPFYQNNPRAKIRHKAFTKNRVTFKKKKKAIRNI